MRSYLLKSSTGGVVVSLSTETKAYCILIPVSWEWVGPGSTFAHGASPAPGTLKLIYECYIISKSFFSLDRKYL